MDPKSIACTNFATGARRKRELDSLYSFYQITATEKEKNDIFLQEIEKGCFIEKNGKESLLFRLIWIFFWILFDVVASDCRTADREDD